MPCSAKKNEKIMHPKCPMCSSEYTYEDRGMYICPSCQHEWNSTKETASESEDVVRDAFGVKLHDGDTVTVIKTLKVKGSTVSVKQGTKVKNIRLVTGVAGHNIDCKIEGVGAMQLKSELVKKA